jgi:hypothetical protein
MTMEQDSRTPTPPPIQRYSATLWPSFLSAGVATVLFFAFFDPNTLLACEGGPLLTRIGAYSVGFFLFWLLTAGSSIATMYYLSTTVRGKTRHGRDAAEPGE